MKVYILYHMVYDGFVDFKGVFSTEEKAREHAEIFRLNQEDLYITELEVDAHLFSWDAKPL